MNNKISKKASFLHYFYLVGSSASWKFHLVHDLASIGFFQRDFAKFFQFYQYYQSLQKLLSENNKNTPFDQRDDIGFIPCLPSDKTKQLQSFDDSWAEISSSEAFVKVATSGRHKRLITIDMKKNNFHQSRMASYILFQNT